MKRNPHWTYPQKQAALHKWIKKHLKLSIPTKNICHNHDAPFEALSAAFFELHDMMIWLANRSGGKTLDFAVLAILDSEANDQCESANFGAIKRQALKCYGYIKDFLADDKDLTDSLAADPTMSSTKFKNKSSIEVLVATISGVNSPHPVKLKADEVELISWFILQEALSMPQSKNDIKATTVLGSTRKFAHGPMQRLIDENQAKVYQWCIMEVMEPWPTDVAEQEYIKDAIYKKRGNLDILPDDLTRFNGYYKWRDLVTKIRTLDVETFDSQWLCRKPDSGGLVYPKFDIVLNCDKNFVVDRTGYKSLQIWEDFGYARPEHPDAIGLVEVDVRKNSFTIFDELWLFEMGTQDIIMEVIQMLQRNHLVDPALQDIGKEELLRWKVAERGVLNYSDFFTKMSAWIPDYHGLTEIRDRQKYGCPIPAEYKVTDEVVPEAAKLYLKENGVPLVRGFVDDRRFKFTPNVKEIPSNFLLYSKKKNADGSWSDQFEKKNDHGPDLVHYGTVYNWPNIAYQSFDPADAPKVTEDVGAGDIQGMGYTAGVMNKVF